MNKSSSIYDPHKLDWVNGEHFRALSSENFAKRALAYLKEQQQLPYDETLVHHMLPVFQDNIERFEQLPDRLKILADDLHYENKDLLESEEGREICKAALEVLPTIKGEGEELYEAFINSVKPKVKAKGKNLFMPIRVALTGKSHGPEMKKIFPVLGMERVKRRFEKALQA